MYLNIFMDFTKIFEFVDLPLTVSDAKPPNNLIYVNKAFCELTGYCAEELLGKNPGELLQRNETVKRSHMRETLNNHEQIDVLVKNYRKDGTWFWNSLHIHPVLENEICLYWVGRATDETSYINYINEGLESIVSTLKDRFRQMKDDLAKS